MTTIQHQPAVTTSVAPNSRSLAIRRLVPKIGYFLLLCLAVGAAGGWLWNRVTRVPSFVTGEDRTLAMSERSSMQYFTLDAGFVLMGLILGLALGVVAWYWLRRVGWPVSLIAAGGALLSACMCWLVGWLIGPHDFADRVAAAQTGQLVPIDFTLRSPVALLIWSIAAVGPIFLYSTLSSGHEESCDDPGSADRKPETSSRH